MKRFLLAGLALHLCALPALAQSTYAPPVSVVPPGGGALTPPAVQSPAPVPPGGGTIAPSMSNSATAQPMTSTNSTAQSGAPSGAVPGANSFTEGQARSRLQKNGYAQVSSLSKGHDGIWRGSAMKDGNSVHVGVDYKGDISRN